MNVLGVLVGLLIAVVVYLVLSAILTFAYGSLIAGLAALVVFLACAFGGFGSFRRVP